MELDKVWHIMAFLGASTAVTLLLAPYLSFIGAFILVAIGGITVGLLKEYKVDQKPDLKDVASNLLGMGIGLGIATIAYALGIVPG